MADDDFVQQVNRVEQEGKARFGEENWTNALGAVGRAAGPNGLPADAMRQVLANPGAADALFTVGRERLLTEASNGDREAEFAYSAIRAREREAHARLKGRR